MIHHVSLAAANPEKVARLLASLWQGEAFPFPPVEIFLFEPKV